MKSFIISIAMLASLVGFIYMISESADKNSIKEATEFVNQERFNSYNLQNIYNNIDNCKKTFKGKDRNLIIDMRKNIPIASIDNDIYYLISKISHLNNDEENKIYNAKISELQQIRDSIANY